MELYLKSCLSGGKKVNKGSICNYIFRISSSLTKTFQGDPKKEVKYYCIHYFSLVRNFFFSNFGECDLCSPSAAESSDACVRIKDYVATTHPWRLCIKRQRGGEKRLNTSFICSDLQSIHVHTWWGQCMRIDSSELLSVQLHFLLQRTFEQMTGGCFNILKICKNKQPVVHYILKRAWVAADCDVLLYTWLKKQKTKKQQKLGKLEMKNTQLFHLSTWDHLTGWSVSRQHVSPKKRKNSTFCRDACAS